jgi:outer membrane protein
MDFKRFLLAIFLGGSLICGAQQNSVPAGWTLEQCIDYALKNNLNIKQSELQVKASKNTLRQSKANTLPTLNAGAAHTYNFGRTIDRYTNSFANQMVLSQNFYAATTVTLWSGLSQYNTIKQNDLSYQSAIQSVNQQKNDLSLNVATAFLQVIYAEQLKAIQQNQVDISKEQLDRTKKLAEAGTLAKSNVFDMEAQLAADEYNVVSADNNFRISLLTLQQLLNLDSVANFTIQKPVVDVEMNDLSNVKVSEIYNIALKNQASIKSAELSWKSAEKGLLVAKGGWSPQLLFSASIGSGYSGLNYNYSSAYTTVPAGYTSSFDTVFIVQEYPVQGSKKPFADQFRDNINKSIGFQLNVPIFNGLRTHTAIENSKLNVFSQKLNYDIARQQLYKNIAQAHTNAVAAVEKYSSAKKAAEGAESAYGFADTKYKAGAISAFDFSTAKSRMMKAQTDLLNSKFDYIFRLKVLDFYQGKPLTF